jgi:hypothetical protein
MENNIILKKLIKNQIKNINKEFKLSNADLIRISNNIDQDIFKENCCIWKGYITNNNNDRAKYINFYFNKKKIALHRLLYINFVGELNKNEYIKYTCNNKGKCCNINHIKKVNKEKKQKTKKLNKKDITKDIKKSNIVSFD